MRKLIMMNIAQTYKAGFKLVLWVFFNNIEGLGYLQERSIFLHKMEQAEVGQWPYLLALRYREGGLKAPPGSFLWAQGPQGRVVRRLRRRSAQFSALSRCNYPDIKYRDIKEPAQQFIHSLTIMLMTTKQEYTRTVRYSQQTAEKFDKIGLKLGRDNRLVFAQMVDYFYKSKKDPVDLNDELLKNTILKQQKEYIGFIKTQEAELLIPVKRDLARLMDFEQKVYNLALKALPKQVENLSSGIAFQNQQLKELSADTERRFQVITNSLMAKEQLKRQFLTILENYAKARENFGVMSPKQEKETLLQNTRSLIQHL